MDFVVRALHGYLVLLDGNKRDLLFSRLQKKRKYVVD